MLVAIAVSVVVAEAVGVAVLVVVLVADGIAGMVVADGDNSVSSAGIGGGSDGEIVVWFEERLISWIGTQAGMAKHARMTAYVVSLFIRTVVACHGRLLLT